MSRDVQAEIADDIKSHKVVLFMKGTPQMPQCGFSATVTRILQHLGVPYESRNVLADPEIRQGIKEFASWPTIPQLYIDGEFVGGCDITMEMFESGELQEAFTKAGLSVAGQ